MDMNARIKRINELYHKSQAEGLSDEEKIEQQKLRREYIESVKGSLKAQLDNIDIQEKDGSITNLGEKFSKTDKKNLLGNIRTKKALIRKDMISKRDLLSVEDKKAFSDIITAKIIETEEYKNSEIILLYADFRNEVSTIELFNRAQADSKKIAYPKCEIINGVPSLKFYYIDDIKKMSDGYFGILEPDIKNQNLEEFYDNADLCIVPLVAADSKCNRVGYGKGFYDRFLDTHNVKHTIGIGYDFQIIDIIEVEQDDKKLDKIITEKRLLKDN